MDRKLLRTGMWILLALVVLVVLSTFILGMLAGRAEKRLDEALKQIAATGDPVEMTQLAKPPIPDEENAALVYRQAFDEIEWPEDRPRFIKDIASGKSKLEEAAVVSQARDVLRRNRRALELIHQAAEMPECDFQRDWSKGIDVVFPEFAKLRRCSRLLSFESMMSLHAGRVDDAVEACSANFRLSNAMDEPYPTGQWARYGIITMASKSLNTILRDSQPSSEACLSAAEEIGKMELTPSSVEAMKGQRALGIWCFNDVRSSPNPPRALAEFISRVHVPTSESEEARVPQIAPGSHSFAKWSLMIDELTYLELMERGIKEAALPYREVASIEPSLEKERELLRQFPPRIMTMIFARSASGAALRRDWGIADLGLAEVSLLLKAYKAERRKYPDSLAELEEFAGRALPEDPFSGEDLVYHREGEGFLLYSWAFNLKDDGGVASKPRWPDEGDIVIQCTR
ncbi:MAG: hypothetical protein GTO55_00655 [Armatimonadetes bacterium]|nr:hypothetical protein [Armatimonadota bacterium]NIM22798.1 hypothetical protein [Armatimonadota bacterium]NIM66665.1 hypothetical protein [Armatimonadota bacterium]NIM75217.1 hypothetical protein [Armatimonadota bacterium]NIN04858.1 hypothetical protein [Armatimonadota bacterium]